MNVISLTIRNPKMCSVKGYFSPGTAVKILNPCILLTFIICQLHVSHRETYIERRKEESSNDRNDRAIRVAARWVKHEV